MSDNPNIPIPEFSQTEEGKAFAATLDIPETPVEASKPPEPVKETPETEKAPVEAPSAVKEASKEEPKKDVTPTTKIGRENWDKLKAEKEEIEKRLAEMESKAKELEPQASKVAELEKELTQLRDKAKTADEYKELAEKAKEYEEIIKRIEIKELPEFKQRYTIQEGNIQEGIKNYLGDEQSKAYLEAFNLPPGKFREAQLEEAKGEMSLAKQTRLAAYENQWEDLQRDKNLELQNAELASKLYAEKRQKESADEVKKKESTFNQVEEWARNNLVTYKKAEGQDAFNADIEERIQTAKRIALGQSSPQELAQAAIYAADYTRQNRLVQILAQENAELKKTLESSQKGDPGVSSETKSKERQVDPMNPKEILSDIFDEVYG